MNDKKLSKEESESKVTRPFFLSILCVGIAVYLVVLSISFLVALIFNGWIAHTLNDFFENRSLPPGSIFWLALSGLILNIISFLSMMLVWQMKKSGYLIYITSSLIFVLFPYFLGFGNIYSVLIILIIIGLLSIFIKKLR